MINAKRLLTSFIALSMTANLFLLSANADEAKDDKAEENGETVEIKVTGYMADDWLAEFDEFSITFEHDGEEIHGYFDKDNEFERWIELQEGVEYNVTYSKELDGRLIEGFDETFTPSKDKTNYMFIVYPNHEDKKDGKEEKKEDTGEEKSEESTEKNDKEKLDTAVKKLTMSEEELAEYKKQRELVQNFLDTIEEYGLCDDSNEYWQGLSEESKKWAIYNQIESYPNEEYGIYTAKEAQIVYGKIYEEVGKERFIYACLYGSMKFRYEDRHESEEKYMSPFSINQTTDYTKEAGEYIRNISPSVEPIWKYMIEYYNKNKEIPNLYLVYLDIQANVDYEIENIEESKNEVVSANKNTASELNEHEDSSSYNISNAINSEISTTNSNVDSKDNVTYKNSFVTKFKDNIITIILFIALGVALLYIKKTRKSKHDEDNDF